MMLCKSLPGIAFLIARWGIILPILILTVHISGAFRDTWKSLYFSMVSISRLLLHILITLFEPPSSLLTTFSLKPRFLNKPFNIYVSTFFPLSLTHCSTLCSLASAISPPLKIFSLKLPTISLTQNPTTISYLCHLTLSLPFTKLPSLFSATPQPVFPDPQNDSARCPL